jgi:hypothetical protein
MNTKLRTLLPILLAAVLMSSGCSEILKKDPEVACDFVQNKEKQRVSWKSDLPLKFRVHKNFPVEARNSLKKAAEEWNSVSSQTVVKLVSWTATGTPEQGYADGVPTIYWLKTWESDRQTEQARTTVVWKGDKIRDADIRINAKDFQFSYVGEDFNGFKVDLVSLMVHEIGHALGFAHSEDRESVMFPYLGKGYDRRKIDHIADFDAYACEYGDAIINPVAMAEALAVDDEKEEIANNDDGATGDDEELVTQNDEDEESEGVLDAPDQNTSASSI